jgi:hypothetical protein
MRPWHLACALTILAGTGATPATAQDPAGGPAYWDSVTAAAREVSGALDAFQDVFLMDSSPAIEGRGLFKQSEQIRIALIYFRQQLARQVPRAELYPAFDKVDREVKGLLGIIGGVEKWDSGMRVAARKLQTATHDLHFAMSAGDSNQSRISQTVYRQTLALQDRTENLYRTVRWVFAERPPLAGWIDDVKAVRAALTGFQTMQQKKAQVEDLRKQLQQVGKVWDRVVARYKDAGDDQYLLGTAVAREDRGFARLAGLFGIKGARAPLTDKLFN